MGILKIINMSTLTDAAALLRVAALIDLGQSKTDVKIIHSTKKSSGLEEYRVIDADKPKEKEPNTYSNMYIDRSRY